MELILDDIPKCVINIRERTDRMEMFQEQALSFFRDKNPIHIIEAEVGRPTLRYVAKSHKKAVQLARDNKWDHVLIMEDDVKFTSDKAYNYAKEAFKQAPEDFDILLGGIYSSARLTPHNEYWSQTGDFSCLHFYVVNSRVYDRILEFNESQHIDRWMGDIKNTGGQMKCFVVNKLFAIQQEDVYSDNAGMVTNYSRFLKNFNLLQ